MVGMGLYSSPLWAAKNPNKKRTSNFLAIQQHLQETETEPPSTKASILSPASACQKLISHLSANDPHIFGAIPKLSKILEQDARPSAIAKEEHKVLEWWIKRAVENDAPELASYIRDKNSLYRDPEPKLYLLLKVVRGTYNKFVPPLSEPIPMNLRLELGELLTQKAFQTLPYEQALNFYKKITESLISIGSQDEVSEEYRLFALRQIIAVYWHAKTAAEKHSPAVKLKFAELVKELLFDLKSIKLVENNSPLVDEAFKHSLLFLQLQLDHLRGFNYNQHEKEIFQLFGIFFSKGAPIALRRSIAGELRRQLDEHVLIKGEELVLIHQKLLALHDLVLQEADPDVSFAKDIIDLSGKVLDRIHAVWDVAKFAEVGIFEIPMIKASDILSAAMLSELLEALFTLTRVEEVATQATSALYFILTVHPSYFKVISWNYPTYYTALEKKIDDEPEQTVSLYTDVYERLLELRPFISVIRFRNTFLKNTQQLPPETKNIIERLLDKNFLPAQNNQNPLELFSPQEAYAFQHALHRYKNAMEYNLKNETTVNLIDLDHLELEVGGKNRARNGFPYHVDHGSIDLVEYDENNAVSYEALRYTTLLYYYLQSIWKHDSNPIDVQKWNLIESFYQEAIANPDLPEFED